jgi:hypothetical protein
MQFLVGMPTVPRELRKKLRQMQTYYILVHGLKAVRRFRRRATHHPTDLGELRAVSAMSSKSHISDFPRVDITDDVMC